MATVKISLRVIICVFSFSIIGISQCPKNSDALYDREKMLQNFEDTLRVSIPSYNQSFLDGFFINDLTEPSNRFSSTKFAKAESCINFIDNHIYHFSVVELDESLSHIAIIENGSLKIFKSINCVNGQNNLSEVIRYVEKTLKGKKSGEEVLTRLRNYRRYGIYISTDGYRVFCNYDKEIPENSDKSYNRREILQQFANTLKSSVAEKVRSQLPRFSVEEERANGFFIYDLTEPSNKQTSLLERIEFKNNHVYHFAHIDLPFSFSNIAVLVDGKLKFFKAINCEGRGDNLKDVVGYLNEKLGNGKSKREIIQRVKNYRKYGVYASFNGLSTPQCEEVIKTESKGQP